MIESKCFSLLRLKFDEQYLSDINVNKMKILFGVILSFLFTCNVFACAYGPLILLDDPVFMLKVMLGIHDEGDVDRGWHYAITCDSKENNRKVILDFYLTAGWKEKVKQGVASYLENNKEVFSTSSFTFDEDNKRERFWKDQFEFKTKGKNPRLYYRPYDVIGGNGLKSGPAIYVSSRQKQVELHCVTKIEIIDSIKKDALIRYELFKNKKK